MNESTDILKQYQGFLKTPQLLSSERTLNAKIFQTDELIDISEFSAIQLELVRQKYLGKRAELFLLQYLISSERYLHVTHSFQIQNDTKTIGELDVICYDDFQQKWIHIELVYKFYVFTGEDNYDDFTHWIGPNLKDRLDYKLDKLAIHQLPLGQHSTILNKLGINEIESYCCYKAKLFFNSPDKNFKSNKLNNKCYAGHYVNFEDFKAEKYSSDVFYVPEKQDWLCEAGNHYIWYSFEKAEAILKTSINEKRSRLVWQKNISGDVLEYFVVWW